MNETAAQKRTILRARNQLPLLHSPKFRRPPLTIHPPGTVGMFYGIALVTKRKGCRPLVAQRHHNALRRTQLPYGRTRTTIGSLYTPIRRNRERLHAEC